MDDEGYEWKQVNGSHYWRIAGTSDSWTLWEENSENNQETSINDSVITGNVQHNKTVIQNDSDSIIAAFLKGVNHNKGNEVVLSDTIGDENDDQLVAKQLRIATELKKENWREVVNLSNQFLDQYKNIDDLEAISSTLKSKGLGLLKLEDYPGAHSALTESIELAKKSNVNYEQSEALLMYVQTFLPEQDTVITGSSAEQIEEVDYTTLALKCAVEMKNENWAVALPLCEEILHHREKLALNPDYSYLILQSLNNKALILYNLDRLEESIPVFTEAIEIGTLKGEDTSQFTFIRDHIKEKLEKTSPPQNVISLPTPSPPVKSTISGDFKKLENYNEHCEKVGKHFSMRLRSLCVKSLFAAVIGFVITTTLILITSNDSFYNLHLVNIILFAFSFLIIFTNNKRQYTNGTVDGKPVLFCSWCGDWVKNGAFSNGPEKMKNHWQNSGHTQEIRTIIKNIKS